MISIILFLAILFIPLIFAKKDLFRPEVFVNLYFIIFIGIGPVAWYIASPDAYENGNYENVMFLLGLSYIFINIGFLSASLKGRVAHVSESSVFEVSKNKYVFFPALFYIFISLIALSVFYLRAGGIPLLQEDKEVARVAALNVAGNGYLLYLGTSSMLATLLLAVSRYQSTNLIVKADIRKSDIVVISVALFVGLLLTGTGSRRYILWTFLYVLIARHYLIEKFKFITAVSYAALAYALVNIFEMFRNTNSDTTVNLITTVYYRLIVYFYNLEAVFTKFKDIDYLYGETFFMDVLTVLPGKQVDYQSWLKEMTGMEFEGFGVPPTIAGDLFINFGYTGVIVFSLFFGFMIKKIYIRSKAKSRKSIYSIAVYALTLDVSAKVLTSGISAQMLTIIWLAANVIIFYLIQKFFKSIFR